jgi:hypothetical protein
MKNVSRAVKALVVLGIICSFTGISSVSATRATPDKGTGCLVKVGAGDNDYAFDQTCEAHSVLKMEDNGEFDFYVYQDHGQSSWHPAQTYRDSFEICYQFSFGDVCGIAKESVTPSGEYKSSFKSY